MSRRVDETWHRLREWTACQAPSERLAAQVLLAEGYEDLDPSHPLGGPDGGRDAVCRKNGQTCLMAVYFPERPETLRHHQEEVSRLGDLVGVRANKAKVLAFVTNQELSLAQRADLRKAAKKVATELYHLERVTTILDKPSMSEVRNRFLGIDAPERVVIDAVKDELAVVHEHLSSLQTGGDTFCYWMLYHFDLANQVAQNFCVIRQGKYTLHAVQIRILDMDTNKNVVTKDFGEVNAPAIFLILRWPLPEAVYYRAFFHARNGSWHQDLLLRRSTLAKCWLAATKVIGTNGAVRFEHVDNGFISEFGEPSWRS